MPTRVFISHANGADAAACGFRDELIARFQQEGFEPLIDQRDIELGADWRNKIDRWMASSHAAVQLLSSAALASPWVLHEASVLTSRRTQQPDFALLPILSPPVTAAQLAQGHWAPLRLDAIETRAAGKAALDEIVARLRAVARAIKPTPLERVVKLAALELKPLNNARFRIEELRKLLGAVELVGPFSDELEQLAERLLGGTLDELGAAVDKLRGHLEWRSIEKLIHLIAPFLWIDAAAASQLSVAGARAPAERIAGLNATNDETGRGYVLRACSDWPGWRTIVIPNRVGAEPERELADEVCAVVARDVFGAEKATVEEVCDFAQSIEQRLKQPVVVLIAPGWPGTSVMRALARKFPPLTFVSLTGQQLPALDGDVAVLLRPELGPHHEKRALQKIGFAKQAGRF